MSLATIHSQLIAEYNSSPAKTSPKLSQLLEAAKVELVKNNALSFHLLSTPLPETERGKLMAARDIFEIACFYSIHHLNCDAFERNVLLLKPLYFDSFASELPQSASAFPLLGSYLLFLLGQNRAAEFHSLLEEIVAKFGSAVVLSSPCIAFAVGLEQCLMEGNYAKIAKSVPQVPCPEYSFFISLLMCTVRDAIAACIEKSYEYLSVRDCMTLLMCQSETDFKAVIAKMKWTVMNDHTVVFKLPGTELASHIPAATIIASSLHYAKELEKIV